MPPEFGSLISRDHEHLINALRALADPMSDEADLEALLEGVRLGFAAHAEAEGIALNKLLEQVQPPPALYLLVSQVIAAHLAQESALAALTVVRRGSSAWRDRARYLQNLIAHHAEHEAACLHPALPDHVPSGVHRALAGTYATERLRAFAMLRFGSDELARARAG